MTRAFEEIDERLKQFTLNKKKHSSPFPAATSMKIGSNRACFHTRIYLFGTIKGLESEKRLVEKYIEKTKPELIALGMSSEDLETFKRFKREKKENLQFFLSDHDEVYSRKLAGIVKDADRVVVPSPSFLRCVEIGVEKKIPIKAVDLPEEEYTKIYCENISYFQLLRYSRKVKKLRKKRFLAKNPKEFVIEWDKEIRRFKGFDHVEKKREEFMAERVKKLTDDWDGIFVCMEYEKIEGFLGNINWQ